MYLFSLAIPIPDGSQLGSVHNEVEAVALAGAE